MRKEIDYAYFNKKQIQAAQLMAASEENLTNEQIAKTVGVDVSTFYRWKKDKKFMEMYQDLCETYMDEFLAEAYRELRKGVRKGSIKAMELYLKRSGKLIDRREVTKDMTLEVTTIEGKTNEQLRKEAIEMERKFLGQVVEAEVINDE
jgi:AcrR family transcriptional regulator